MKALFGRILMRLAIFFVSICVSAPVLGAPEFVSNPNLLVSGALKKGTNIEGARLVPRGNGLSLEVRVKQSQASGPPTYVLRVLDLGEANASLIQKILKCHEEGRIGYSIPSGQYEDVPFIKLLGKFQFEINSEFKIQSIKAKSELLLAPPSTEPSWIQLGDIRTTLEFRLPDVAPKQFIILGDNKKVSATGLYFPGINNLDFPFMATRSLESDELAFGRLVQQIPWRDIWPKDREVRVQFRISDEFKSRIFSIFSGSPNSNSAMALKSTMEIPEMKKLPMRYTGFRKKASDAFNDLPDGAHSLPVRVEYVIRRGFKDYERTQISEGHTNALLYENLLGELVLRRLDMGAENYVDTVLSQKDSEPLRPLTNIDEAGTQIWLNTGRGLMRYDKLLQFALDESGGILGIRARFFSGTLPPAPFSTKTLRTDRMEESERFYSVQSVEPHLEMLQGAQQPIKILVYQNGDPVHGLLFPSRDDSARALVKFIERRTAPSAWGREEAVLIEGPAVQHALHRWETDQIPIHIYVQNGKPTTIQSGVRPATLLKNFEQRGVGEPDSHSIEALISGVPAFSEDEAESLWKFQHEVLRDWIPEGPKDPSIGSLSECRHLLRRLRSDDHQKN